MEDRRMRVCVFLVIASLLGFVMPGPLEVVAQGHPPRAAAPSAAPASATPSASMPTESVRITMEELHRAGGVPPGWRFTWPAGDSRKGREVFAKLECYQCHAIQGETFPAVAADQRRPGPELTGMGGHHPVEYFAESIVNPNAVIVTAPGHTGPDGRSIMPDYRDSLTVGELVDVIAFLKSLKGEHGHGHQQAARWEREQTVGDYRIRLAFHDHGHGSPHHAAPPASGTGMRGHLVAFINDVRSGEPVPYLPVAATIHTGKGRAQTITLAPMIGQRFHYGADVAMPATTTRVTLNVGPTTMRVMESAGKRFGTPASVNFEWRVGP
jgi:hypothetical protein